MLRGLRSGSGGAATAHAYRPTPMPPRKRWTVGDVLTINRTPTDFVSKTRHLSIEDRGAYQEILDQIVILGQKVEPPSLPDDDQFIANLLGCPLKKWRTIKFRLCRGEQAVLLVEGGRISQTRIVEEIEAARLRIAQASRAGSASVEARRKLRDRMLNSSLNVSSTPVQTGVPTRVVPEGQLSVNSDHNSASTSHESRVMKEEETEPSRAREDEPEETPFEKPPPNPAPVAIPDFAAAQRIIGKLEHCALKLPPPDQIAIAWVTEYGPELVEETLIDCEDAYRGKGWQYFERILTTRRGDPSQRPGNRRAKGNGNGSGRVHGGAEGGGPGGAGRSAEAPERPHYAGEPVITDEMRERAKQPVDWSTVVVSSKRKIVPPVPKPPAGGS